MTRVDPETKKKLIEIILEDCAHRKCVKHELVKTCETCESFGEWHLSKDLYNNQIEKVDKWTPNRELLEGLDLKELMQRAREVHGL